MAKSIVTLALSLILQNGGLILFGSAADRDPDAAVPRFPGRSVRCCSIRRACVSFFCRRGAGSCWSYLFLTHTRHGQSTARRPPTTAPPGDLYGDRCRSRASASPGASGSGLLTAISRRAVWRGSAVLSALCRVRFWSSSWYAGGRALGGSSAAILGAFWGRALDRRRPARLSTLVLPYQLQKHGPIFRGLSADHLSCARQGMFRAGSSERT